MENQTGFLLIRKANIGYLEPAVFYYYQHVQQLCACMRGLGLKLSCFLGLRPSFSCLLSSVRSALRDVL